MYERMLVPLDGSQIAESVLPYAREIAGRLDLELTLLHICEPAGDESQFMCRSYLEHAAETIQKEAEKVREQVQNVQ